MIIRMMCAGFGGQGALLIGKMVAEAGMREGKYVTWLPSYGPEMRGGTANVMTVISDKPVGSPIFTQIDVLVALNQPSLDKYSSDMVKDGIILANSSLCTQMPQPEGVRVVPVPLTRVAEEMGNNKVMNMAALGALIALTHCVSTQTVENYMSKMLKEKNPGLFSQNMEALHKGVALVEKQS